MPRSRWRLVFYKPRRKAIDFTNGRGILFTFSSLRHHFERILYESFLCRILRVFVYNIVYSKFEREITEIFPKYSESSPGKERKISRLVINNITPPVGLKMIFGFSFYMYIISYKSFFKYYSENSLTPDCII